MGKTQEIGRIGEDTACKFLIKKGFSIVERNHLRKWGEIDIVAKKAGIIHFIEVKTISCERPEDAPHKTEDFRPEENVHKYKLQKLSRVFQTYLLENGGSIEQNWCFDVVAIHLNVERKIAKVNFIKDIIINT